MKLLIIQKLFFFSVTWGTVCGARPPPLSVDGEKYFKFGVVKDKVAVGEPIIFYIHISAQIELSKKHVFYIRFRNFTDNNRIIDHCLATDIDEEAYPGTGPDGTEIPLGDVDSFNRTRVFEHHIFTPGAITADVKWATGGPEENDHPYYVFEDKEGKEFTIFKKQELAFTVEAPETDPNITECHSVQGFTINDQECDCESMMQPSYVTSGEWLQFEEVSNPCEGGQAKNEWTIERLNQAPPRAQRLPALCPNFKRTSKMDMSKYMSSITQLPLEFDMRGPGFTLQPYILPPGFFRICLNVTEASDNMKFCGFFARLDTDSLNEMIELKIKPEGKMTTWPTKSLTIDAEETFYRYSLPESGYVGENVLSFSWTCTGIKSLCHAINSRAASKLGSENKLSIDARWHIENNEGIFVDLTVTVKDPLLHVTASASVRKTILFVRANVTAPVISMGCIINCGRYIDPKSPMLLSLNCDSCDRFSDDFKILWNIKGIKEWEKHSMGKTTWYLSLGELTNLKISSFLVSVEYSTDGTTVAMVHKTFQLLDPGNLQLDSVTFNKVDDKATRAKIGRHFLQNLAHWTLDGNVSSDWSSIYPLIFTLQRTKDLDKNDQQNTGKLPARRLLSADEIPEPSNDTQNVDDNDTANAGQGARAGPRSTNRPTDRATDTAPDTAANRAKNRARVRARARLPHTLRHIKDYVVLRTFSSPLYLVLEPSDPAGNKDNIFISQLTSFLSVDVIDEKQSIIYNIPELPERLNAKTWNFVQDGTSYDLTYLGPLSRAIELSGGNVRTVWLIDNILNLLTQEKSNPINYSNINLVLVAIVRIMEMGYLGLARLEKILDIVLRTRALTKTLTVEDVNFYEAVVRAQLQIVARAAEIIKQDPRKSRTAGLVKMTHVQAIFLAQKLMSATADVVAAIPRLLVERFPHYKEIGGRTYMSYSTWRGTNEMEYEVKVHVFYSVLFVTGTALKQAFGKAGDDFIEISVYSTNRSPLPKYMDDILVALPVTIINIKQKNPSVYSLRSQGVGIYSIGFQTAGYFRRSTIQYFPVDVYGTKSEMTRLTERLKLSVTIMFSWYLKDVLDIHDNKPIILPRNSTERHKSFFTKGITSIQLPKLTVKQRYLEKNHSYYILIRHVEQQPFNSTESETLDDNLGLIGNDTIIVKCVSIICTHWSDREFKWKGGKCRPTNLVVRDPLMINCQCDVERTFSAGINKCVQRAVLANWTDFEITPSLEHNQWNWIISAVTATLWLIGLIAYYWAMRKDSFEKPLGMLHVLPRVYSPYYSEQYMICVATGWWKSCGTDATPTITLIGTDNFSVMYSLPLKEHNIEFQTGSEIWLLLSAPHLLGTLNSIILSLDPTEEQPSWFVSHLFLRNLRTGEDFYCVCDSWIPDTDNDNRQYIIRGCKATAGPRYRLLVVLFVRYLRHFHILVSPVYNIQGSSFNKTRHIEYSLFTFLLLFTGALLYEGEPNYKLRGDVMKEERFYDRYYMLTGAMAITVIALIPHLLAFVMFSFAHQLHKRTVMWKHRVVSDQFYDLPPAPRLPKQDRKRRGTEDTYPVTLYIDPPRKTNLEVIGRPSTPKTSFPSEPQLKESLLFALLTTNESSIDQLDFGYTFDKSSQQYVQFLRCGESLPATDDSFGLSTPVDPRRLRTTEPVIVKPINQFAEHTALKKQFPVTPNTWHQRNCVVAFFSPLLQWSIFVCRLLVIIAIIVMTYYLVANGFYYTRHQSIIIVLVFLFASTFLCFVVQPLLTLVTAAIKTELNLCRVCDPYYKYATNYRMADRRDRMVPSLKMHAFDKVERIKTVGLDNRPWIKPTWKKQSLLLCVENLQSRQRSKWNTDQYSLLITLFFLFVTIVTINLQVGGIKARHSQHAFLKNLLHIGNAPGVTDQMLTYEDFWHQINKNFVDKTYLALTSMQSTSGFNMLSAVQLTQVRVQPYEGNCSEEYPTDYKQRCSFDIEAAVIETRNFEHSWLTLKEGNPSPSPFTYIEEPSESFSTGRHQYPGGGYQIAFSVEHEDSEVTSYLQNHLWLDDLTRAVVVEMNCYNADADLVTTIKHVYEFSKVGIFAYTVLDLSYHLYFEPSAIWLMAAFTSMFIFMTAFFILSDLFHIYRYGLRAFFYNLEVVFLLPERILCVTAVVLIVSYYFERLKMIRNIQENFFNDTQEFKFVSLVNVVRLAQSLTIVCSSLAITCLMRLMIKLRHNKDLHHLIKMSPAAAKLIIFPITGLVLFSVLGHFLFAEVRDFSTFVLSLVSLSQFFSIDRIFVNKMIEEFPYTGPVFILLVYTMMAYVIVSFFIVCLNETYSEIELHFRFKGRFKSDELIFSDFLCFPPPKHVASVAEMEEKEDDDDSLAYMIAA